MRSAAVLTLLVAVASCRPAPAAREYQLAGQILLVEPDARQVLIRHGDIVGFMPGMTMTFTVHDAGLLRDRAPGELVTATLVVTDEVAWLRALVPTGHAPLPADAPKAFPAASGVHVLGVGDQVPATPLTTSSGAPFSLASTPGRATAITFVYTRCPLPDYCPLMDRRFAELQRLSAREPTVAGKIALLSVSFDPEVDTPERLAEHARAQGADPRVWQFATIADPASIDRFAATFGVNVIRERDGWITHNLRTVVVGPAGTVVSVRDGTDWSADDLLRDLKHALGA